MPTAPAKSATGNLSRFMPADAVEIVERKVSRYQSARDNKGKPIALVEILEAIQAGHWEKPVAAIREALAAGDTAKAETLKTNLEGFTVSGVFAPTRAKIYLKEPTGCIIVDVDHLASTAEAEATRDTLGTDPHVLAAFVSPSGRGVKAVVYVGTCADDKEAKSIFRALAEYLATTYQIETDPSGKDVCRLCFVSHDPGAIIRTGEVRPFTARVEVPKPAAPAAPKAPDASPSTKPSTAPDAAVIRSAVAVLDAGCPRADWLAIGCAIKNALGDSGFQIFDSWSATAPGKYDSGETRKLWDTIAADGGVTVGTLYKRAEDAGWINPTGRLALSIRRQQAAEQADGEAEAFTPSGIVSLAHFLSEPVPEPPQVIRDVLRAGQIAVGASSSKGGKTWLMQSLGLAVATGKTWLAWRTTPGRVLFIDPELCHYDGQRRMMKLMEAMGLKGPPEGFDFWRVKGKNLTIADVERHVLKRMKETGQTYTLIIVDSVYCFGGGRDENSNSEQAETMQELYTLSELSGAAVFITHHFSKGNKSMTDHLDRASGAGVFARAPDVFMTLTPHQEEGCFTVETTCRSFARPEPFVARWEYPLWKIDGDLDPDSLKRPGSGRGAQFTPEQIMDLLPEEGLTHGEWREKAKAELGCGKSTFNKLLGKLKTKGLAVAGFGRYVAGSGAEL